MQLHISPGMLISEVQKQFNSFFPFLKIEFFKPQKLKSTKLHAHNIITANKPLLSSPKNIKLNFNEQMKVKDLEKLLEENLAVPAQIFRKSGTLWLETTMTDDWTLQQQNDHGKELSEAPEKPKENEDFDLTRDADH